MVYWCKWNPWEALGMRNCKHCHFEVDDDTLYMCPNCGRVLPKVGEAPASGGSSGSGSSGGSSSSGSSAGSSAGSGSSSSGSSRGSSGAAAEKNAGGGLLVWSVVNLVLCTIPGVAALALTVKGRAQNDAEKQKKYLADAKVWNIVATIAGLAMIVGLAVSKLS